LRLSISIRTKYRNLNGSSNRWFVVITCLDLQSVCALVAERGLSRAGSIAPIDILYGHSPAIVNGNVFMAHRCGSTKEVLTQTAENPRNPPEGSGKCPTCRPSVRTTQAIR